jgi:uncharacterized RDD family membrane protein YckC
MAPQDSSPTSFGDLAPSAYPGERLGMPEHGPGSIARAGRRILGILIDWGFATVISYAIFHGNQWATLLAFIVLQIVFIPTIGGSIGHLIVGLRVVPLNGGWVGPWRPIVRTVMIALVIPAVTWDSDHRGYHDKIAGTVLMRAR